MPDAPRPTSGLTEPGTPDERDGTDGVTTPERQRGTAVPVSSGPGSARPTSELAADATARARAARSHLKSWYGEYIGADSPRYQEVAALADTIDALLARITDLEALNTGLTRDFNSMLVEQSKQRNRVTDLEARAEGYKRDFLAASERVVAAEAQVAAFAQERDAAARYCMNVHGDMLCDGPQGHDGGCTFTAGWMLARRIEEDLISTSLYAGDTTNELRDARDDRDEGWRQHNRAEIRAEAAEAALAEERDAFHRQLQRADAAETALAEARQALADALEWHDSIHTEGSLPTDIAEAARDALAETDASHLERS